MDRVRGNHKGQAQHSFGLRRPSYAGGYPIHQSSAQTQAERDTHYRDLPPPTGQAPFQLDLQSVIAPADYARIVAENKLTFHLNGDMGGIEYAVPQQRVANGMERDFVPHGPVADNPAFLYITGDCVYFNGEIDKYYSQFYQPYDFYNAPIFAVPGNHDGENLPGDNSLDGFVRNFCAPSPVKREESLDSHRTAMMQPNVYWTLLTPMVNIVGLYSNVPEGGDIREPQTSWLIDQLESLPTEKPLFVALHHPIYSADDHHSGSTHMRDLLHLAATAANRLPDMVLAGHVHNYQRITKKIGDAQYPYLVIGAGGYHNLHRIMKVDGQKMIPPVSFDEVGADAVTLEHYADTDHGFLRMEITQTEITGRYYTVPKPAESEDAGNRLDDYFEFDWRNKKYLPNKL